MFLRSAIVLGLLAAMPSIAAAQMSTNAEANPCTDACIEIGTIQDAGWACVGGSEGGQCRASRYYCFIKVCATGGGAFISPAQGVFYAFDTCAANARVRAMELKAAALTVSLGYML